MRTQPDRDTVTLDIVTALLLFVLVAGVGAVLALVTDRLLGADTISRVLGAMAVPGALAASVTYLWRQRRPRAGRSATARASQPVSPPRP